MIRAVIFDLDNTLTDFMLVKELSIQAAVDAMLDAGLDVRLKERGVSPPGSPPESEPPSELQAVRAWVRDAIRAIYDREGIEYQHVFNTFLSETLGAVDYRLLAAAIVGYRRARDSALVPYPHVHLTLHRLMRSGLKLAVLTDAPREQAWLRLVYLNLHHVFDEVITYEDTGVRKPDRAPFEAVLGRLGLTAERTLMIGDWPARDMAGAAALGIHTVLAHYGYSWSSDRGAIEDHPADHTIHDILELVDIVRGLNAGPP
jgi:putative hydrolase of the HAD superfamily